MSFICFSRVFRGKFLAGLGELYAARRLALPGPWVAPAAFAAWRGPWYGLDGVVYSKPPFGGPEQVLKYLARSTHWVALSNQRLVALDEAGVTFAGKDYAHGGKPRRTLSADEFLRPFVQHVLPKGFGKVRHYGVLANRDRAAKRAACRALLVREQFRRAAAAAALVPAAAPWERCPVCGGARLMRRPLSPGGCAGAADPVPPPDTS
jgi:hypothetical protein